MINKIEREVGMVKKEAYVTPEIDIVCFEIKDIITTSEINGEFGEISGPDNDFEA